MNTFWKLMDEFATDIETLAEALALSALPLLSLMLVLLAIGVPILPAVYLIMAGPDKHFAPAELVSEAEFPPVPSPKVEDARDQAFEMLNIKPVAREWMVKLRIQRGSSEEYSGWYDPTQRTVVINQPYVQVFLHEFAHANFDRKSVWERTAFIVGIVRLYFDADRYPRQNDILEEALDLGISKAKKGQYVDIIQEMYAFTAQSSKGDLDAIPDYLRPYYADFLNPGRNTYLSCLEEGSCDVAAFRPPDSRILERSWLPRRKSALF